VTDAVRLAAADVRIGGRRVLGPLDLAIGRGERWALLGPNGGGKTTALALMGARRQPSAGSVTVLGARLGRTDVRALRGRIGHVSHRVAEELPGQLTVLDTVLAGRDGTLVRWWQTFDDEEIVRARTLLHDVGCAALADQRLATCSLGERQRVLLARALFGNHELLLLDEPAAGLDLPARELLIVAMTSIGRDRTTVLATHHLEELPATTTHAALLADGRIIVAGPVRSVLSGEALSACFGVPVDVTEHDGRWSARSRLPS
jgi:iron complex transport system ATP-binding protein